ncbi:MAG: tetratricopeptide repeat protein, partial [Rhodospirillales bacterium]
IEQNYFKAAEWYSLASNLGRHAQSQFALAQLYFNGRGVPHDYAEALALYRKAARRGHAAAQYLIGAMYQDGWGVKSDYAEAYKWYSLALPRAAEVMAVNSSYDPARALERLKKKMRKFQIGQGEKRLKEWRRSR